MSRKPMAGRRQRLAGAGTAAGGGGQRQFVARGSFASGGDQESEDHARDGFSTGCRSSVKRWW